MTIKIEIFGAMSAESEGEPLALGGPKQQCVLAMLIGAAPASVSADSLAQALYGEDVPASARRRIQTYISTLRSVLGDVIVRSGDGWKLMKDDVVVDSYEFEAAVSSVSRLRAQETSDVLHSALELWRGAPFGLLESHGLLAPEIGRLEELRLQAIERRVDADLELGRSSETISELSTLIHEHPFRESLRARHILALYRSGRQEEALASITEMRTLLVDELGLDPTPELQDLEARILRHDPSLRLADEPDGDPLRGFRLFEEIGSGAFSVVWRGVQPSIGREVAIKQIRQELASQPDFIRRFEVEAQLIARVEHPHVVPLIDYWRDPDSAYLVMRWLRGGTLRQRLVHGALSLEETERTIAQVGGALSEAHRLGVIHRDVTSNNILLDEEANAFLGDFGIASMVLSDPEGDGLDETGLASVASPAYAAPEQLRREEPGPKADIFSLGVVAYECLTGALPFTDTPSKEALIQRQMAEPFPLVSSVRSGLPDRVDHAVARATAKDPADRFESVAEFLTALAGSDADTASADRATSSGGTIEAGGDPYKGLRAFEEADSADFFGRDRLLTEVLASLDSDDATARCLSVVGPSGSGKSSLVQAGVLPALRAGEVTGSASWFITTMVPGARPYEALEAALLRVAVNPPASLLHQLMDGPRGILRGIRRCLPDEDQPIVLVIDQFEELFTSATAEQADAFLDAISTAVQEEGLGLRVIATLRADYYHRPLSHPLFAPLLKAGSIDVTPLAPDELEAAIVGPASRRGLSFEPGVVVRIAAEATQQPAALPMLQHAMSQLVEHRSGDVLTLASYEKTGGLAGSLASSAERIFNDSSAEEQAAIRRMFGRLVSPEQSSADLRRRALRTDLGTDDAMEHALARFGEARLITFDRDAATREPTVEVAHEALLREWPRLIGWLDDDRALLRSIGHLSGAADSWDEGGRSETDLYRGVRLEGAGEIFDSNPERLRVRDRQFVEASVAAFEAEQVEERRRSERLRRLLMVAGVALIAALIAGGVALQQRGEAQAQTVSASARGLSAQAVTLAETELDTALLLAANAASIESSPAVEAGLLSVLNEANFLESSIEFPFAENLELVGAGGDVAVGYYQDGENAYLRSFNPETFEPIGPDVTFEPLAQVGLEVSKDGSTVVVGTANGQLVADVASGDVIMSGIAADDTNSIATLSPNGRYLAVGSIPDPVWEVYDLQEQEKIGDAVFNGDFGFAIPAFSTDESVLYAITGDPQAQDPSAPALERIAVPRMENLEPVAGGFGEGFIFPSPDGSLVATVSVTPTQVQVFDGASLEPVGAPSFIEPGRSFISFWNPTSTKLAIVTLTSEVFIFDPFTGQVEAELLAQAKDINGAFWLDADRFSVLHEDRQFVWNLAQPTVLAEPFADGEPVGALVDRDGRTIVRTGESIELADTAGNVSAYPLPPQLHGACFHDPSISGGHVVIYCVQFVNENGPPDLNYGVMSLETGDLIEGVRQLPTDHGFDRAAVSPDGSRVAFTALRRFVGPEAGGEIALFDVASGEVIHEPALFDDWAVLALEWTPDGDTLLAGGQDADVLFINPDTWEVEAKVETDRGRAITDLDLSRDLSAVLASTESGQIFRVDLATQEVVGEPLAGAVSQFQNLAESPDGSLVAATGRDGAVRIWEAASGRLVAEKLEGGSAFDVSFVDDETIVTSGEFGSFRWDLSTDRLISVACELSGRTFTDAERELFADDLADGDACQ